MNKLPKEKGQKNYRFYKFFIISLFFVYIYDVNSA